MEDCSTKSAWRWAVILALAATLVFAFALSAQAAVKGVTASTANRTANAVTAYDVSFVTDAALSVGSAVYVDFQSNVSGSNFNLGSLSTAKVKVGVSGAVYDANARVTGQTVEVAWPGGLEAAAGDTVTVSLQGVQNPPFPSTWGYYVGVRTAPGDSSVTSPVAITAPALVFKADQPQVEINLRDKVTLELRDETSAPVAAGADIDVNLFTDLWGSFYPAPADESEIWSVRIPSGESRVDVYYRPEVVGNHTISGSAYFYGYGSLSVTPAAIEATPAAQVQNVLALEADPLVAGKAGKVTVRVTDQYGNPVPQATGLTVNLKALASTWDQDAGDWTDWGPTATGKLLAADASGNLASQETVVDRVYIAPGQSEAVF